MKAKYAVYPYTVLYGNKKDSKGVMKFGFIKQLIFGDYIMPVIDENGSMQTVERKVNGKLRTLVKVRARGMTGYVLENGMQDSRVTEVNFIDVGQGDGCHLVTPDDKHFLIDAGVGDNMYRFLRWRFNFGKGQPGKVMEFTSVISHSDKDHYGGFSHVFRRANGQDRELRIPVVYHNGMIEHSGTDVSSLGDLDPSSKLVVGLARSNRQTKTRLAGKGNYTKVLNMLTDTDFRGVFKRSVTERVFLYDKGDVRLEVLGPFLDKRSGDEGLPVFKDKGKTKNGHSVILMLHAGKTKVLLGGDLNSEAENYLLKKYSGVDFVRLGENQTEVTRSSKDQKKWSDAMAKARKYLQCDFAKSCHHGSSDFTSDFLSALNPLATIVSSGDDESYCHPRPDTLGTLGKFSRGKRSLIFSTELARSHKEFIDLSKVSDKEKKLRVVTVYGMINLRTDGRNTIIAQKLERPAPSKNWDIHRFEWNELTGEIEYISK